MTAVRPRRSPGDRVLSGVSSASTFARKVRCRWRQPWLAPLVLPVDADKPLTIGRAPDCDLVLSHPTISRRHATLRPRTYGWELVDLGSTNGTRVNGWWVRNAQPLHAGDVVSFGALSLAVTSS
jgi:hypothetical protein